MTNARTTETIEFPIGDYPERLDVLYKAAEQARQDEDAAPRSLLEGSAYDELWAGYEALRAESKQASRDAGCFVVIEELTRSAFKELRRNHPPRTEPPEVAKLDGRYGLNLDTVSDDLVRAALVEPVIDSDEAFDDWVDSIGQGKFSHVANRALALLSTARIDPKSLPASPTQSSAGR